MGYELDKIERRVLGVLVEKGYTTPDQYPLSMNAIVNGCNQKSCREPVMSLDEVQVFDAIDAMRKQGLVICAHTGNSRVEKYRHCVPEMFEIVAREAAVLAELLLRGPQTDGELRQRANRMIPISSLEQVQEVVESLIEKELALRLSPPDRKRGARFAHRLYPAGEQPKTEADAGFTSTDSGGGGSRAASSGASPAADPGEIAALRSTVEALTRRVAALEESLGVTPEGGSD